MKDSRPVALTTELLEQLADRWRERGAPIVDHLRAGLTSTQMDQLTGPLGLRLSAEARTWWGWHDGTDPALGSRAVERDIGGMIEYFPLEEAVAQYHSGREVLSRAGRDPDDDLPPSWFPITRQGHGDVVVCDCGGAGVDVSPIHIVVWEQPQPEPAAASFGDMVSLWIAAIDAGAWVFEADDRSWYHGEDVEVAGSRFHRLI